MKIHRRSHLRYLNAFDQVARNIEMKTQVSNAIFFFARLFIFLGVKDASQFFIA